MRKHWMLASNREFDEGTGTTCPDTVDRAAAFVLRCQGGGAYAADSIGSLCVCGKPPAAIFKFPEDILHS